MTTNTEILNFDNMYSTYVRDISWSPDSTKLATVSDDQVARIWQIVDSGSINGTLIVELDIPLTQLGLIESLDWSPDGQYIAIGGSGGQSIQIWDANTYQLTNILSGSPYVSELEWKPDITHLSLAGAYFYEGQAIYYDTISSELSSICNICVINDDGFQTIAWNHTGTKLALGTTDGMIHIIDMPSGNTLLSIATGSFVNDLAWSPNDNVIVSSSLENTSYNLNLWDTLSGEFISTLDVTGNIPMVDFHPMTNEIIYYDSINDVILSEDVNILIPTPTPTHPPTSGDFTVTARIDGQDDNQQSIFAYTLTNTSSTPQSNLYMRLFFTVDNERSADDYILQSYYDSSNALIISGPFQWDATNHYFILSYGSSTLAPNASYQFQGVLRLADFSNNHSASNDWWHTGILSFQDSLTDYLPVYVSGVLNTGLVPSGAPQPTNTPAPTTTVAAPTSTPSGTAVIQVESRIDGNDDTQQAGFRYRLSNTSTQAQGNLSTRIYFTLDGSQVASDYVLEKYFDQSGVATISGPILANGNTYYFQVTYGGTSLQPNSAWEFQGALHLVNYASNFSSSNDWWRTGVINIYTDTDYLPTYINGVIEVGQEP
ncbi:MAG: hypothetical protein WBC91_14945 [Phototrophicaceae bacterium]